VGYGSHNHTYSAQSTRKPFQTDNVSINAMVSVVQSGITCVKENEDIGTILKVQSLPPLATSEESWQI
jgi:hypothetical protein